MFSYLFALLVIFVIWKIKKALQHDELTNYGTSLVPVIKNSINLAFLTPVQMFEFPRNCAKKFKASYKHYFFGILVSYNVIRAKDAEKVLSSSKHNDKSFIYNLLEPFLKTGLLTSNGDKWHTRRRMLTPAFHFDILKEFFEVFSEESDKLVETLRGVSGREINIVPVSTQFTLNTICESAMGVKLTDLGNDGDAYRNRIYEIGNLIVSRIMKPWLHFKIIYSILGYKKILNLALQPVHDFTKSIIKQRRSKFLNDKPTDFLKNDSENIYFRSKKRRYAMMDTLLQAQQQGAIDDEGIIEETDTFTFEGHDTTSAAMTFSLLLLAHHPEAQMKIFEECQRIKNDTGREELTIDDFNKMEYLDRVIKECLRIYPPVPFIARKVSEDFVHDGFTHYKGSAIHIHIYDIHRDPEVFPDPEKFDPDRFLPENSVNRSNFAFIAFSAGMRNCIGQRFAMLELKVMLTKVISSFKISPITAREEISFIADLILRPQNPIKMKFYSRNIKN